MSCHYDWLTDLCLTVDSSSSIPRIRILCARVITPYYYILYILQQRRDVFMPFANSVQL